jgi:hypothetical protein
MVNMQIKDTLFNLIVIAVIFAGGYYFGYKNTANQYQEQIVLYQAQLDNYKDIVKNVVDIENSNQTEVAYKPKTSKADNDIELTDSKDIKIKYNGKQLTIPNKVNEQYKFENGKLIIDRQEQYALDLTANIDGLVEDRAKLYSRVGKADYGVLYNSKGSDWYGGIRYNAKAYDIGYYHSINNNEWIMALHYKF